MMNATVATSFNPAESLEVIRGFTGVSYVHTCRAWMSAEVQSAKMAGLIREMQGHHLKCTADAVFFRVGHKRFLAGSKSPVVDVTIRFGASNNGSSDKIMTIELKPRFRSKSQAMSQRICGQVLRVIREFLMARDLDDGQQEYRFSA